MNIISAAGGSAVSLPIVGNGIAVVASTPLLDLTQTWNNGAVAFTGIRFNATNTASLGASMLIDLQVGAASQFSVNRSGAVTTGGNITIPAANFFQSTGRSRISSPADGQLLIQNNAGTAFTLLQLGGTTNAFPALKRVATGLSARLADDSADAPMTAQYFMTTPTTLALLISPVTAGMGARAFITDATSGAYSTVATGGGAQPQPVFSDGTSWRIG